jgi:hypothetical protein
MKKLSYSSVFFALLLLAAGLAGCKSDSVVSDSSAPANSAALQTSTSSASATNATGSAAPVTATSAASAAQSQQPAASPTLLPIMKQAQAKPGVPVSVPESMRRPLNAEEMKKALEQMPPEVRARIQGMQAAPPGIKPQATPKNQ